MKVFFNYIYAFFLHLDISSIRHLFVGVIHESKLILLCSKPVVNCPNATYFPLDVRFFLQYTHTSVFRFFSVHRQAIVCPCICHTA